jgi:hypothetical protein
MKMIGKKILSALVMATLLSPLTSGTARADWDDHRGDGWEREHREHEWRAREYRERERHERAYRRVYDWRIGQYVLVPAYAAAPVYAYPAPQRVYAAPIYENPAPYGFNMEFNIR